MSAPTRCPLGIGLVGCGFVTRTFHLPALRGLTDLKVVAVADVDETSLREVAAEFAIGARYRSAEELVQDARVAAVGVCVPPGAHADVVCSALEAGKHVLVEKPLAASLEDATKLVECAERAPGSTMMGFNLRWHRLVRQARSELRSGRIGTAQCVRSVFSDGGLHHPRLPAWRREPGLGGDVLLDLAVHHFDLWRWLLDDEVRELFAVSGDDHRRGGAVTITGRMREGTLVSVTALNGSASQHVLEIYGDAGSLTLDVYRSDGLEVFGLGEFAGAPGRRLRRAGRLATRLLAGGLGGDFAAAYGAQWLHFADVIRRDAEPACGLEDGRRALEVALAAGWSAANGAPVTLPCEQTNSVVPVAGESA
jgi:myo-inositol 2-dehydrogenase / D-chiro-inositol 1-dehydrogenase